MIFGASKIETKTTITASGGGGEVTVGDLTADIRTDFSQDDLNNSIQNLARDLTLTNFQNDEIVALDNIEIFYLAEDRSDATDLTFGSGGVLEAFRFRLNGVELPFTGDGITIATSNTNASPIADSACKDAFDGLLLQDLSASASSSETSVGKASRATASRWATEMATTDIL